MSASLPFMSRLVFAWLAFFRILFDGAFAARLYSVRDALPEANPKPTPSPETKPKPEAALPSETSALQLLALFQREGRLVDFLQQDVTSFSDADVGAAARVVHDGAKKALDAHVTIAPVRDEDEGARVSIEKGTPAVKLVGQVGGSAPYRGVLRHRGWRVTDVRLPTLSPGHDAHVLAPAEVEL